jgi:hypothetical protein
MCQIDDSLELLVPRVHEVYVDAISHYYEQQKSEKVCQESH